MQSRVLGSVAVVVVALIPAIIGGPTFALLMILLGIIGFHEYLHLMSDVGGETPSFPSITGYIVIVVMAIAGLAAGSATVLFAITVFAVFVPLVLQLPSMTWRSNASGWSRGSVGSLYLGLPIYAAVSLRALPGSIDAPWLSSLASLTSFGWPPAPRGLAWALATILVIWTGDTMSFLVGRTFGKRKLAPSISPGKSIEGAVGGLLGSMLVGSAAIVLFGIATWPGGLAVGAAIGGIGQVGDLCESALKRQSNAKDSGTLIPGHGGILDRIDAMLFAFPTAFLIAVSLGRLGS